MNMTHAKLRSLAQLLMRSAFFLFFTPQWQFPSSRKIQSKALNKVAGVRAKKNLQTQIVLFDKKLGLPSVITLDFLPQNLP